MLNDFFITRDAIGFLQRYLDLNQLELPTFRKKLLNCMQKQQISYEQWWLLLDELASLVNKPALGLEIGKCVKVEHCGVLGYLFRTSRNMSEALSCFKRYQGLIYGGSKAHIETCEPHLVKLIWNPDHGYSSQLSDDILVSAMVNIAREIISPHPFNPISVDFTHTIAKEYITHYKEFFRCDIKDGQAKLMMTFQSADLFYPIPHEDQTLNSILGKQAEQLLELLPEDDVFLVELRDTIIRCLHEGRPDAQAVAEQLNISMRTLHRRLKEKNRVYRDILKDIRKSMAVRYMTDVKLTLSEIALLLGYAEQSTFSRAFTGWYGLPPYQYKRLHLEG